MTGLTSAVAVPQNRVPVAPLGARESRPQVCLQPRREGGHSALFWTRAGCPRSQEVALASTVGKAGWATQMGSERGRKIYEKSAHRPHG